MSGTISDQGTHRVLRTDCRVLINVQLSPSSLPLALNLGLWLDGNRFCFNIYGNFNSPTFNLVNVQFLAY